MATAPQKARRTIHTDRVRNVAASATSESMQVVILEDNGGDYHWTLQDCDGRGLAHSPHFASYADAEAAVRRLLAGVGSARLVAVGAPADTLHAEG